MQEYTYVNEVIKMLLYVINFKKGHMIKIGIGKSEYRIHMLNKVYSDYELDMDNVHIVTAKNDSTITTLERQLLEDYSDYKIDDDSINFRDGHTELRKNSIHNKVIADIKEKALKFPNKNILIEKKKVERCENTTNNNDINNTLDKCAIRKKEKQKKEKFNNQNLSWYKLLFENLRNKIKRIFIDEYGRISVEFISLTSFNAHSLWEAEGVMVSRYDNEHSWCGGHNLISGKKKNTETNDTIITLNVFEKTEDGRLTELVEHLLSLVNMKFVYSEYLHKKENNQNSYYFNKRRGKNNDIN